MNIVYKRSLVLTYVLESYVSVYFDFAGSLWKNCNQLQDNNVEVNKQVTSSGLSIEKA